MYIGRLVFAIYSAAIALAVVGVGSMFVVLVARPPGNVRIKLFVPYILSDLARQEADPVRFHQALEGFVRDSTNVSFYDARGTLRASASSPPLALPASMIEQLEPGQAIELPGSIFVAGIWDHGELTEVGVIEGHRERSYFYKPVLVLLLMILIHAVVIARYVGSPLQRLTQVARRFGAGDLGARANLRRKDEIGAVGRAFDDMADRVTKLMGAQRELMASVSHELQTPLARMRVSLDLLADGIDKKPDVLPAVSQDLWEISRLIDDVMAMTRVELVDAQTSPLVQPLQLETIAIEDLIDAAATRFHAVHDGRDVIVNVTAELPLIEADYLLVRRVVENLLDNAAKYSPADTAIEISARGADEALEIVVKDRGIGIRAEDMPHIFTPFFRTDRSRAHTRTGIGLGLALSKRVLEAHGGTIAITSSDGETSVTMTLPVNTTVMDAPRR